MQKISTPVAKDLVLIGGGHAHVIVLKKLAMKPVPGLRLTLITRDIHTPYSGMLPGFIAGHYDYDECHIDLGPLARLAGARLYHSEVEGIDLNKNQVILPDRPTVNFDLASINIGSRPTSINVAGVDQFAIAAKPIDLFLIKWQTLQDKLLASQSDFNLVIVGGGAGGVELALATQHKLKSLLSQAGDNPKRLHITLLTDSDGIMHGHNSGVKKRFEAVFNKRGINVKAHCQVTEVQAHQVLTANHESIPADGVIWVTTAAAAKWPKEAGLDVDEQGFIRVNKHLQSTSHAHVFAAGDIASLPDARPKSGVFAVRQGPILKYNLKAAATQKSFKTYAPQKNFLGLVSTGDKYAVASRGSWSYESAWLWKIKNWIDQQFMHKFNHLPEMDEEKNPRLASGIADAEAIKELSTLAMRCGGCGAKVGATILTRVMQRLPVTTRDDVLIGRDAPDDCAMLAVPEGKVMVQSVDYFRAFIDDTYTFGAIAANHALGDVFAMGAEAQSVLAIATVPYGREKVVEETLYDLLAGALSIIEPSGAVLAGGHSSEGAELAFGLNVNGIIDPSKVWRKSGLQAGDKIILTKPIGTGTLFAADMRMKAKGRWIDAAIQSMVISNQQGAQCLQQFKATACTDLTGFGLIGHLIEMTKASQVDATLYMDALPLLDGALNTVAAGILSSLQPQNLRLRRGIRDIESASKHPAFPLLFDPQTAGGLIAGIPAEQVDACIAALKVNGYAQAAIIGEISTLSDAEAPIKLI